MNNEVVADITSDEYVDVFGRVLDTFVTDDGEIYVPLSDLKKSGFSVFLSGTLPKPGQLRGFDEKIFDLYKMYLESKSTKFIMYNKLNIPENKMNEFMNKLHNKYFDLHSGRVNNERVVSNSHGQITVTTSRYKSDNFTAPVIPDRFAQQRQMFDGNRSRGRDSTGFQNDSSYRMDSVVNNHNPRFGNAHGNNQNASYRQNYRQGNDYNSPVNNSNPFYKQNFHQNNGDVQKYPYKQQPRQYSEDLNNQNRNTQYYNGDRNSISIPERMANNRPPLLSTPVQHYNVNTTNEPQQSVDTKLKDATTETENVELLPSLRRPKTKLHIENAMAEPQSCALKLEVAPVQIENQSTSKVIETQTTSAKEISPVSLDTLQTPETSSAKEVIPVKLEILPTPATLEIQPSSSIEPLSIIKQENKVSRKTVTESVCSGGLFDCTEIINETTFLGVAMPAEFAEEVCSLDLIKDDTKPDNSFRPNLGDLVAVPKDDYYVRAIIINNLNRKYDCALIDYGIIATVDEVRSLPEKYKSIPEFACMCEAAPDIVTELSKCSEHLMKITIPSTIKVTSNLTKKTFDIKTSLWEPTKTSPLALHVPAVNVKETQNIYQGCPKSPKLNANEIVIIIAKVEEYLILRTRECNLALKEVVTELEKYEAKLFDKLPGVNQIVLCPFEGDGLYRAVIISISGAHAVVEYCDYGNRDTVALKDMKTVNENLATRNSTLIKIKLKGFVRTAFNPKAIEFLVTCYGKKEKFVAVPCNGDVEYDLLFLSDKTSLSQKLIALDKPLEPASPPILAPVNRLMEAPVLCPKQPGEAKKPVVETVARSFKIADQPILKLTDVPRCILQKGMNRVMCLYAGDLDQSTASFCPVLTLETSNAMGEISEKINAYVATNDVPYKPQEYEVCLARFDGDWYRAACITAEPDFTMYYLDFGNVSSVSVADIRQIPIELTLIKCMAALCMLQDLPRKKDTVTEPLLTKLQQAVTENSAYDIEVVGEDDSNTYLIRIPEYYENWKKDGLL